MLYPKRIWISAGKDALTLRNAFTVGLPKKLHTQLHREVDKELGAEITEEHLPDGDTISKILQEYEKDKDNIEQYDAEQKLRWFDGQLSNKHTNFWLKLLIRKEIDFLVEHKNEL